MIKEKTAVFWPYKYADMRRTWSRQVVWLADALSRLGFRVLAHPRFHCAGLNAESYVAGVHKHADVVIYNHADASDLVGNILPAGLNLFFKPTVPTADHTTLDELGYGPFSSISYAKPDFEVLNSAEVDHFMNGKVKAWIAGRCNKWDSRFDDAHIAERDYWLVLAQCGGDSVNTRHDFGHYFTKLLQVTRELVRIDRERSIIVKLHPHTDGVDADGKPIESTETSGWLRSRLAQISSRVQVHHGMQSVQSFLPHARAVILGNSGAGFEAMMHRKPIIAWGKPEYHWVAYDLRHLAALIQALRLEWFDPSRSDKFLYWYTEKYCFFDADSAFARVRALLGSDAAVKRSADCF